MAWQVECVRILRYLVNDLDETSPVYSDSRLQEALVVAAQILLPQITFPNTYVVNVDKVTIAPDPTTLSVKDDAFINLVCLKAGCIIDQGLVRAKLAGAGYIVKVGNDMVDTREVVKAYSYIAEYGLCKIFNDARWEYLAGNLSPGRAILGPFSSPNLNTDISYYNNERQPTNNNMY